jgi:hypothetical protein
MSVDTNDMQVDKLGVNLNHPNLTPVQQQRQLEFLGTLNRLHRE